VETLPACFGIHVGCKQLAAGFAQSLNPLGVFGSKLLFELLSKTLG
jgi:hypothetical protein